MKIIVFCGLTISFKEASKIIKADFRPPARHGDLISCVYNDIPDVIVLIDGIAVNELSVWHSEIKEALNKGVAVYGASAMGAIRAAEMRSWGVTGVGEVFRLISDGTIDADDEVFCDFLVTGDEYQKKTIPCVNLRYILDDAVNASIVTRKKADAVLETAKSIFYQNLTPSGIISKCIDKGIMDEIEAGVLSDYISSSRTDIQKQDAVQCLEAVKTLRIEDLDKRERGYEYDLFFEALNERDRGTKNGDECHAFFKIANDYAIYAHDIESVNDAALNRKICALVADNYRIEASEDEIKAEKKLFTLKHGISGESELHDWLKSNDLTEIELNELMTERIKITKLQNWYRTRLGFAKNTRYLLEELKLSNRYTEWKQKSIDIHEKLKSHDEKITTTYNSSEINALTAMFQKRNSRSWGHSPFNFINNIGMTPPVFKYLLSRDKILSDIVARETYDE